MRDDRNTPRKRDHAPEEQRSDRPLVEGWAGHRWASPEAREAARKAMTGARARRLAN
ncbi:MAG: hypothetical protein HYV09_34705 [Deltaproteobacteria bacterium]|nr:hypothetical protein [Deltaproteobacteria bacterium]